MSSFGYHDLTTEPNCATVSIALSGSSGGGLTVQSGSSLQNLLTNDLSESCWLTFTSTGSTSTGIIDITLAAASPYLVGMTGLLGMSLRVTATVNPTFSCQIFNGATMLYDNDVPVLGSTTPGLTGFYEVWQDCGDLATQQWIRRNFRHDFYSSGVSTYAATKVRFLIQGLPNGHLFEIGKVWISRAFTTRHGQIYEPDSMGYDDPSIVEVTNGGQVQSIERAIRRAQNIGLTMWNDEVSVDGGRLDYLDRMLAHSGRTKPLIYMPADNPNRTRSYQRAIYGYLQSLRYGPVNLGGSVGEHKLHLLDTASTKQQVFQYRSQILEAR